MWCGYSSAELFPPRRRADITYHTNYTIISYQHITLYHTSISYYIISSCTIIISKVSNTTLGPKFLCKSKSFTKHTFRARTAISSQLSTPSHHGASDGAIKTTKTELSKNKNSGFASIGFQDFSRFFKIFTYFSSVSYTHLTLPTTPYV